MFGGPIFVRELYMASRRPRTYWVWFALLGGVYLLILLQWPSLESGTTLADLPAQARNIFINVALIAFFAIALIGPASSATTISLEKETNTLPILLLSDTGGLAIVGAKALFKLFLIFLILLLLFPMAVGLMAIGGIEMREILQTGAVLGAFAVLTVGISLLASVLSRTGRNALLFSYVGLFVILFGLPLAIPEALLHRLSPLDGLRFVLEPQRYLTDQLDPVGWQWNALLQFGAGALCIGLAGLRLPAAAFPRGRSFLERVIRPSESVTGNPFRWLELRSGFLNRKGWNVRIFPLAALGMGATYFLFWGAFQNLQLHLYVIPILLALLCLAETVIAATSVTLERENQTWVILATTPVDGETYLKGKSHGIARNLLPLAFIPLFHLSVFCLAGVLPWYLLLSHALLIFVSLPFFIVQGLWCSFSARTSVRALIYAVSLVLVESLLTVAFRGCLPISPPAASYLFLESELPAVAAGTRTTMGGLIILQIVFAVVMLIVPIALYRTILVKFDRKLGRSA